MMTMKIVHPSVSLVTAASVTQLFLLAAADAVRTFGLLTSGVGADRWALDDAALTRVHRYDISGELRSEPVEAPRCGTALLLANPVVLRAVAGALEPLRRRAV